MFRHSLLAAACFGLLFPPRFADPPATGSQLTPRLAAMTAVTGFEQAMVDSLLRLLPGAKRDRAGNAVLVLGSGEPRRLAVCPLDEVGFVVGGIGSNGYLTLRRVGRAPTSLFDQQIEGQRVTVFGRRGAVPAVVAVRSTHLTRGRLLSDDPFTVDQAYVDVGATTAAEVSALGIQVLAPVALTKRPQQYGAADNTKLAAPSAGRRGACAALLAAALERPHVLGTGVVGFAVEQNMTRRGILTLAHTRGPFESTVFLDGTPGLPGAVVVSTDTTADTSLFGETTQLALPMRYHDTASETVTLSDVDALERRVSQWMVGD